MVTFVDAQANLTKYATRKTNWYRTTTMVKDVVKTAEYGSHEFVIKDCDGYTILIGD